MDPELVLALERFYEKVVRSDTLFYNGTPCLLWTGGGTTDGYGQCYYQGRKYMSHKWHYEVTVGPVPEGMDLDHLCEHRRCLDPSHLKISTHQENLLRGNTVTGINKRKTECLRGHPFDEKNTRIIPGIGRKCRTCEGIWRETARQKKGK